MNSHSPWKILSKAAGVWFWEELTPPDPRPVWPAASDVQPILVNMILMILMFTIYYDIILYIISAIVVVIVIVLLLLLLLL